MKPHLAATFIGFLLCLAAPAQGGDSGKLTLIKGPDLGGTGSIMDSCEGQLKLDAGKHLNDLRGFSYYFCDGIYSIILEGPPGKTVTLFGDFDYNKGSGYLVVRKKDAQTVWISNLAGFAQGDWQAVRASGDSGAFDAFFRSSPKFAKNIASVRWGKWWEGGKPD